MKGILRNPLALILVAVVCGLTLRADAGRLLERESASRWSGSYWYTVPNSTMSFRLVITPASRFNLSMGGCFGSSEVNQGTVAFRDGFLMFDPGPSADVAFPLGSNAMIPMRSSGRLYLVSADRYWSFAHTVARTDGGCNGACPGYFVRESDLE